MIIALVVTFVLAWAFLFYLYRDVFSPWSVTLGVWSVILFMYLTLNHELYHACVAIIDYYGEPYDQEPAAYLQGYLMRRAVEVIGEPCN